MSTVPLFVQPEHGNIAYAVDNFKQGQEVQAKVGGKITCSPTGHPQIVTPDGEILPEPLAPSSLPVEAPATDLMDKPKRLAELAEDIFIKLKRNVHDVYDIGRDLCEAKELVKYGEWLNWLKENFPLSERTARNFMEVYRQFKNTSAKIADLPPSLAYALSSPAISEKVIEAVVVRVQKGEKLLDKDVKAIIVSNRPTPTPPAKPNGNHPIPPKTVDEHLNEATVQIIDTVMSAGVPSVNGQSIAGAVTEETAEAIQTDRDIIIGKLEQDLGLDTALKIQGEARVAEIFEDQGRITFISRELAEQLKVHERVQYIVYVHRVQVAS